MSIEQKSSKRKDGGRLVIRLRENCHPFDRKLDIHTVPRNVFDGDQIINEAVWHVIGMAECKTKFATARLWDGKFAHLIIDCSDRSKLECRVFIRGIRCWMVPRPRIEVLFDGPYPEVQTL